MCCVSFRWLIWFSRHKACGVSTWNRDIRVLLVKLFCQTLWDSQPTKQPKKIKLLLAFTSGLFLIVSVGISGLGLLSCHLSVRITCFSYCSLLPATYFKRWNSLNGFLFSSLTVLPAYLKCSTALYAKLYAVIVLLFNKKKGYFVILRCGLQADLRFFSFPFWNKISSLACWKEFTGNNDIKQVICKWLECSSTLTIIFLSDCAWVFCLLKCHCAF